MDDRPWGGVRRRESSDQEADRVTASLAGLAVTLLLVVIGLVLVQKLQDKSRIEDCIMSGRTNCAPIEVPRR